MLELVPPPWTVADIASALNVFTLPWLRDVTGARYIGYDLNADFVAIGNAFARRHIEDLTTLAEERGWRLSRATLSSDDLVVISKT